MNLTRKQSNCLKKDEVEEEFFSAQETEFKAFIKANKSSSVEELRVLILGWIKKQSKLADERFLARWD